MIYNELRTLSVRLRENLQLQRSFQVLNLPGRSQLLQLQAELTDRPIDKVSIPIHLLNTAMRALVPDLIYNDGDGNGFSEGIFQMGERVFASTYNTPKQFKLNRDLSKASTWTTRNRKTKEEKSHPPSPDVYYWNPGLVELTVACVQPEDNPSLWAALAHELRHIALHHDEPLKLPLPLHLAKLIEDYVLLIENDSSSDSE